MHIVPASDELASCVQEQGDKSSYNTWAQARRDIPTLNLVLSAADTFHWLAHLYIHGNINNVIDFDHTLSTVHSEPPFVNQH